MSTVNIRKQGGAAIITIPAEVLRELAVGVGQALDIEVSNGALIARPTGVGARRRYSLSELLDGVTPAVAREMAKASKDWNDGSSVGCELP